MDAKNSTADSILKSRPPAPLTILLVVVTAVFCGILIFVYVATKRANPVMLDQQGKRLDKQSEPASTGAR
jgi:hypothetical protein